MEYKRCLTNTYIKLKAKDLNGTYLGLKTFMLDKKNLTDFIQVNLHGIENDLEVEAKIISARIKSKENEVFNFFNVKDLKRKKNYCSRFFNSVSYDLKSIYESLNSYAYAGYINESFIKHCLDNKKLLIKSKSLFLNSFLKKRESLILQAIN